MDSSILKADIFFVITAMAVVVLTVLLVIALVYLIRILRNVRSISDKVKLETDNLASDLTELREDIKREGRKWKHYAAFFKRVASRKRSKKT